MASAQKFRVRKDLNDRALRCADEVQRSLAMFTRIAVKKARSGFLDDVVPEEKHLSTTRKDSTVITIPARKDRGPIEEESAFIRSALAKAVAYAEPLITPKFVKVSYRENGVKTVKYEEVNGARTSK